MVDTDSSHLARTDIYFITFDPTELSHLFSLVDTYYPTVLLADTVCTHSDALLLLVQLNKIKTHYLSVLARRALLANSCC